MMNIIPALEIKGWRAYEKDCTNNRVTVKYKYVGAAPIRCELCSGEMQRRGYRHINIRDTPYMQYDVTLRIEAPCVYCPHCRRYVVKRPEEVHPRRGMTWRFMCHIACLMRETSARLLSGILRISESSVLRADKEMLRLVDAARPVNMDGRRGIIIDEKYLGRAKKFVTSVIDAYSGEILWLKEGKGTESLKGFFERLTREQKEEIEVVSIDRSNAYLKALREHLPHVKISFDPFHIIKNANDATDKVRREVCRERDKEGRKLIKGRRYLLLSGEENLSDDKREELEEMLELNAPLNEAYLLKEKLRVTFQFSSWEKCASSFAEWLAMAAASTLKPFKQLAKTLAEHAEQVHNLFRYRLTSGRIEGVNSMISRIQLKTRGLPSIEYLRLKLRLFTSPAFKKLFSP